MRACRGRTRRSSRPRGPRRCARTRRRRAACRGRCRRTGSCSRARSGSPRSCPRCRGRRSRRARARRRRSRGASRRPRARSPRSRCTRGRRGTSFAMPPWTSASWSDLYASFRCTYLPTTPIFTVPRRGLLEALDDALPRARGPAARLQMLRRSAIEVVEALRVEVRAAARRCSSRRSPLMTASTGDVREERDLLLRRLRAAAVFVRQSRMSGWMPISRISFTECCVGFVFSSPAVAMYGTSVTCTLSAFCGPASILSWRIASRNGSDSMSPTVPPISTIATSTPVGRRRRGRAP